MPVGDCQAAFGASARRDGVLLQAASIDGLTDAGHLALSPGVARAALERIFAALGGDEDDLAAGRHGLLRLDWYHDATSTPVEVDESQHFTSDRLVALRLYPPSAALGFDLEEYIALCERHAASADRYRAAKPARGFRRAGGRRAQRAYFDALRDLALPELGCRPVVRAPAIDGDGVAAYRRVRPLLQRAVGVAV